MLVEMMSPAFVENGITRPSIKFKRGLNVILGKEDGENSIGKSSALLAVDFVFGGDTYIRSDAIKYVGHHEIFFAFEFAGEKFYFSRSTETADLIQICDDIYIPTDIIWKKQEYVTWLKEMYCLDFPDLAFRDTVSRFFRIYGKENLDERKPLRGISGEGMKKSIGVLVRLFDKYKDIEEFSMRLEEQAKKLKIFRDARQEKFIPNMVGGKTQYEENLATIDKLTIALVNLTDNQAGGEDNIKISREKARLKSEKLHLETAIQTKERKLELINMSLKYGRLPKESELDSLQEFFPGVSLKKIYEVERYHKKLAAILDGQLNEEKTAVQNVIAELKMRLIETKTSLEELGSNGNLSKEFLDLHSSIKSQIESLKQQNEAYLTLTYLQDERKNADNRLKQRIRGTLSFIQNSINGKMKEYNDTLFSVAHKPPQLLLDEYNSYQFETPADTGTGSNYKGLVMYDLAILALTALPAIAHDSLILKNVSDGSIDGIMKIYECSKKQIFIAFDKQNAYKPETRRILVQNTVLKLSSDGSELYGRAWNKEESSR